MKEEKDVMVLEEITEGEDTFKSDGYSYIKITRDGVVTPMKVKIQSTGITELIDQFDVEAPKPPAKDVLVHPDSEMGIEMGLSKKQWVKIPNLTDKEYIEKKQEHESNLGIAMLMRGMVMKVKDKDKNEITDKNKKIEVLRKMGMSGDQFTQIVQDIQDLTRWKEEERESFLEGQ